MQEIQDAFTEAVTALIDNGWYYPIRFVALAVNGTLLSGYYEAKPGGGARVTITTEARIDDVFVLPVNVMFTNPAGDAVRVAIAGPGKPLTYH
jgi:hypothetical protein